MTPVLLIAALLVPGSLFESDAQRAMDTCLSDGHCTRVAQAFCADGAPGNVRYEALLATSLAPKTRRALVAEYTLCAPLRCRSDDAIERAAEAFADPLWRGAFSRVHSALAPTLFGALLRKGVRVVVPSDGEDWCRQVFDVLARRLDDATLEPRNVRHLLSKRCAKSDAVLTRLAIAADREPALLAAVDRLMPYRGSPAQTYWSGNDRNSPWQRIRPFLTSAIRCETSRRVVDFESGPYTMAWGGEAVAFVERTIEWLRRCPTASDWSALYAQLGAQLRTVLMAAQAPDRVDCATATRVFEEIRILGMPQSLAALTPVVARCAR